MKSRRTRVDRIKPPSLFEGAPYNYVSKAASRKFIFTAGACPLDQSGIVVGPGDLEKQTRTCLKNLVTALVAAQSSRALVLKTTVFVATRKRADLLRAWKIVAAAFRGIDPPSTLLGVSVLGYPGQLVEIEAVAVSGEKLPKRRSKKREGLRR